MKLNNCTIVEIPEQLLNPVGNWHVLSEFLVFHSLFSAVHCYIKKKYIYITYIIQARAMNYEHISQFWKFCLISTSFNNKTEKCTT